MPTFNRVSVDVSVNDAAEARRTIDALRIGSGWTWRQVAAALDVDTSTLRRWVNGDDPRDDRLTAGLLRLALIGLCRTPTTVAPVTPDDLRVTRRALGLSQSELASKLGYSLRSITNWECGAESIPSPVALRLALDAIAVDHSNQVAA